MKLRSIIAGAVAFVLSTSLALAQTGQGTSPLTGSKGGTNSAFMQFTGPATSIKTYTLPNASDTIATLAAIQTFTAAKTFASSNLLLAGSSSGAGTLNAPAAASTYVWTLPAATGTLADIASAQTFLSKTIVCANQTSCVVRIGTDVSGLGTGVATALAVNVGSAGAPVVNGGALGTPSSGTATNLAGTASGLTAGNVTTNANLTGDVTSVGNATTIGTAKVTYAMMQNVAALSVVGRSANSSGVPAAISCVAASDAVLRESGSVLGCGTIATAGIAANAVTNAKLATMAAYTIKANATGSSAVPTDVSIPALTQKPSLVAADKIMIADSAASDALKYATVSSLASAGSVASLGGLTGALTLPIGQGRLTKSGANLILLPFNGNLMTVNGATCTVPDAGVTLAPTALSVGTLYYIYATCSAGAINALEASTTGHSTSTTAGNKGVEIKTADDTRTLVGMARIITGPAWADTAAQRFVVSWFNRLPIDLTNNFTTTRTNATAVGAGPTPTFGEVNTEVRIEFLCWSTDAVTLSVNGSFFNSGANTNIASIGVDSTSVGEDVFAVATGTSSIPLAMTHIKKYSEGYHFATILNGVSAGTASYYVFGNTAGGRTTLKGLING